MDSFMASIWSQMLMGLKYNFGTEYLIFSIKPENSQVLKQIYNLIFLKTPFDINITLYITPMALCKRDVTPLLTHSLFLHWAIDMKSASIVHFYICCMFIEPIYTVAIYVKICLSIGIAYKYIFLYCLWTLFLIYNQCWFQPLYWIYIHVQMFVETSSVLIFCWWNEDWIFIFFGGGDK